MNGSTAEIKSAGLLILLSAKPDMECARRAMLCIGSHLAQTGMAVQYACIGTASNSQPDGCLGFSDEMTFLHAFSGKPECILFGACKDSLTAWSFSRLHGIPCIQFAEHYECYTHNGSGYNQAAAGYSLADHLFVTSEWLKERVALHCSEKQIHVLPLGFDQSIFSPAAKPPGEKPRICMILGPGTDQGQWVLLDVLNGLVAHQKELAVTVLLADGFSVPGVGWEGASSFTALPLPADPRALAEQIGKCDIFVDAAFHEGYPMLALQAMACGSTIVASDSGGNRQLLQHQTNSLLITAANKPAEYVAAILTLARNKSLLARMQRAALDTAAAHANTSVLARYAVAFQEILRKPPHADETLKLLLHLSLERFFHAMKGPLAGNLQSAEIERLGSALAERDRQLAQAASDRAQILSGASFRLGRMLTAPIRVLLGKS